VNDTMRFEWKETGSKRTARLFCLGKQTLLKRSLLLQVLQTLVEIGFSQLRTCFRGIILGEDAMSIRVENDKSSDGI
jgi:hypothetical protein